MKSSLEKLKNKHKGEKVVIFSCDPSLNCYSKKSILELCKDKKVFTIKQSLHKYPDLSDYHFFNDNNFSRYSTPAIKIASSANLSWAQAAVWGSQEIDYEVQIVSASGQLEDSLSYSRKFKNMLLEPSLQQTWGPGIMYETVLPFAIHMGFTEIIVNGWDYTTKEDGTLDHYYDESRASKILTNTGIKIGTMAENEKDVFISSTKNLNTFLKSRGIKLKLLSNISELDDSIERIEI